MSVYRLLSLHKRNVRIRQNCKKIFTLLSNGKNIMGLSHKSHGKRSDKETQSPMLKIFKDMMQKDKRSDPEKTNLLKEKHHDRKRKHYSGSRSKMSRQTLSSSSDHPKNEPYKLMQEKRNAEFDGCTSQHTMPFQGEKRESWWFWGDTAPKKSNDDDTCSCVSCALKKLISTDYACIACITTLLVISVLVALMLVYKNIPYKSDIDCHAAGKNPIYKSESERLKRKIGLEKWKFGPKKSWRNIFKKDDDLDLSSINFSDNGVSNLVESENELSKILGTEKLSDIQHSERLRDFYKKLIQTDAAIRNLRKNLDNSYTSTSRFDFNNNFDINSNFDIKNYDFNSNLDINSKLNFDNSIDADRLKRSIRFHPRNLFHFKRRETTTESKISNGKLMTKSTVNMTSNKKLNDKDNKNKESKLSRNKRFGNISDGFIIEKNKVMIQYKPRVGPKCSHSPMDTKSHEKELSHPFYKNTQRLDELLDQFMDKKLPDLLSDNLQFGMMFGNDKKKKCKHPSNQECIVVNGDSLVNDYEQRDQTDQGTNDSQNDSDNKDYPNLDNENQNNNREIDPSKIGGDKTEISTIKTYVVTTQDTNIVTKNAKHTANVFENDFFEDPDGEDKKIAESSTGGYDILLSISTLVSQKKEEAKRITSKPTTVFAERPNQRKLLQTNIKAEDGVAYEDLKEVLADYKEGNDDEDKENDRKKRNENAQRFTELKMDENKQIQPISMHNPNWKGPMPLYPDELNQMVTKAQYPENTVEIPVHNRDLAPETDEVESGKSDVEYVEDYLDNGYKRLVELAQAYSDYGVLNEKKDKTADKKATDNEDLVKERETEAFKKLRNSFKSGLRFKQNLFEKIKQGRHSSEGIRIEFQPDPSSGNRPVEDTGLNIKDLINKHVKIGKGIAGVETHATEYKSYPDVKADVTFGDLTMPMTASTKIMKNYVADNNVVYKKRTLKSDNNNFIHNIAGTMSKKNGNFNNSMQNNKEAITKANMGTNILIDKKIIPENATEGNTVDTEMSPIMDLTFNNNINNQLVNSATKTDVKINNANEETDKSHTNTSESTLSNFFILLSNWFSDMDKIEVDGKNMSKLIPSDNNVKLKINSNTPIKSGSHLEYPAYDSDMIENIGRRSRVLLSVEVANNTEKVEEHTSGNEGISDQIRDKRDQADIVPSSTEPMNTANSTQPAHAQPVTAASLKDDQAVSNGTNNRMVKRQAIDDSNLLFWNDLYDEEYGVNADSIESDMRDKHGVQKSDSKKPNSWLQDKMKIITDKIYPGINKKGAKAKLKDGSKHSKRNIQYGSDDDYDMGKFDLAALTKRMKEVCKETVKAVQDTNHIRVREDNQEGQAATSLMQQLVRLMTDLVDYQVQEKTCRKLPPDLQSFLEWLTSSKEEDPDTETYLKDKDEDNVGHYTLNLANKLDKSTEQDLLLPSEKENTDSKTDCLGTLHAVQNLIREYEDMTEDDKSVMTGVKSYLENQMHFLQRQLSSIDDLTYYNRGSRYKRDVMSDLGQTVSESIDDTAKQLEKQYKNLKCIYHKYKNKIGPAYKEAIKTTDEINKAVTDITNKVMNHGVKTEKHTKLLQHEKGAKHQKVQKHQKVAKIKDRPIEHNAKWKAKINNNHRHAFFRKNKTKPKKKVAYVNQNYPINEGLHGINVDVTMNKEYVKGKDERNIKDVYFKAVEEAKKSSLAKGAHKRDRNMFDTDIFRVNDNNVDKDI